VSRHPALFQPLAEDIRQGQQQRQHQTRGAPVPGEKNSGRGEISQCGGGHVAGKNTVQQTEDQQEHAEGNVDLGKKAVQLPILADPRKKFQDSEDSTQHGKPSQNQTDKHKCLPPGFVLPILPIRP